MKKRADGRYCKQVLIGYGLDGKRKTRTVYGKTIREVETKERNLKAQIDLGLNIDNLTVGEWADIWLKTYKLGVEYNTFRRYQSVIGSQIKPLLGRYRLKDLKPIVVQSAINELCKSYSLSTIKKFKITLNQLCKCAMVEGRIATNPCLNIDVPKTVYEGNTTDDKFISDNMVTAIKEFCQNYRHGGFIMTLLYTGIRRGEIVALTWQDVDIENNCIYINKAVEFVNNRPRLKGTKSKSGVRTIPLLDVLRPYLLKPANISGTDCIFKNSSGNMHTETSLRRMIESFNKDFRQFLEKRELKPKKITMHQFRHTYATFLYKAGIDMKTAQSYLGHSSISVTMDIYTHLDKKHKQINAEKLNAFISA